MHYDNTHRMDFELSAEQRQVREEVRRFAENEIRPVATEYDRDERFPAEVVEAAAEMGLTGMNIPMEYGGAGYDTLTNVIAAEELFAADAGIGLCIQSAAFGADAIIGFGTDEQKERFLEPVATGEAIMGAAISETDTGSDVSSVSTRARKEGDEWVVDGNKMWITNGSVGDFFVVLCETDPEAEGRYNGFSQIVVESDRDGFEAEKITGKLGIRASDTAELIFDGVRVPLESRVGAEGEGTLHMMRNLEIERLTLAAMSLVIAQRCLRVMIDYANERKTFGRPIREHGQIQRYIAETFAEWRAARTFVYDVARRMDLHATGQRVDADAAKLFAAPVGKRAADAAIQVLGGYGYMGEYVVSRLWRDAKLLEIGGGTLEAHHKNLVKDLARDPSQVLR